MTPTVRTAFRITNAGITGLATFSTIAATGWLASVAASDYGRKQEEKAAQVAATAKRAARERAAWLHAHPVVRVVQHRRPHRTVVRTVTAAAGPVAPGRGGTISRTSSTTTRSSGGGGTRTTHTSSGTSSTPVQPAPPPPPPAPSSGS